MEKLKSVLFNGSYESTFTLNDGSNVIRDELKSPNL